MARSVNKVILLGNVGKDPEIRATAGGMTVANFSIATTDRIKGQDGQYTDKTEWHNLVAFQRTAEIIRDYVKKGNKLYVEGRLQTSSWDDKATGQKKYKTEIIVSDLSLLSGKGEGGSGESTGGYSKSGSASYDQRTPANPADYSDVGITDDDIPF
jgi:single-strand DNA-binding protein